MTLVLVLIKLVLIKFNMEDAELDGTARRSTFVIKHNTINSAIKGSLKKIPDLSRLYLNFNR